MEGRRNILYIVVVLLQLSIEYARSVENDSLNYNYFDEMAQTYCASKSPGWVFAIRRNCDNAPTCHDICASATSSILGSIDRIDSVSCCDAVQIKKNHPVPKANSEEDQPDSGKVNLFSYGYGPRGCTWRPNDCGPNYCCCKAF
ncbi:uncharacterized protein LOC132717867 [Ruditapes philippinarum]|uniref:uncharacterized protein LOC132717867 n=1 Tax=Ruditapes philippinarum TaxID=129788 RepID=UPI00295BD8A6|nr:uncharacterized protein LOC132717867 [Ruditapes philippinarum]